MKQSFAILRDRPKLAISVTRDSVCAADDVMAPNEKQIEIHSFTDPEAFMRAVAAEYGMPTIQGGKATWEVFLNDEKIGVISQEWNSPRATITEIAFDDDDHVFLRYHAQADPRAFT